MMRENSEDKKIKITCKGADLLPFDSLEEFQGDLKKINKANLEKLKKRIIRDGINVPLFIWRVNDWCRVLDGHQRIKALQSLREDGYILPMIPVAYIEAENEKDARQKLLGISSQFGEFEIEELEDWIKEFDKDMVETINLGNIKNEFNFINTAFEDEKENTIFKSDREKRQEEDVSDEEKNINIYEWINSFKNIFVMFSGGKDSMALVADLLDNNVDKEKMTLLFNTTPLDYKDLKEFVLNFSKVVNIPVEVIGKEMTEDEKREMFERNGFPLPYMSWCTGTWKVQPMNSFLNKLSDIEKDNTILCQGWRREESDFRSTSKDRVLHGVHNIRMARPILDYKEKEVYDIIKKHKWELHPCYKYSDRLGCIYCFSRTRDEWDVLREKDPKTFLRALSYVADGLASENISQSYGFNAIRKMMGKPTILELKKGKKKK